MLPEIGSEDYKGARDWEEVRAHLPAAVAAVREVIGFNEPVGEEQERAYKAAVCAALDVDAAYGFSGGVYEGMQSMALGSFSVTMQQDGSSPYDHDMRRAIERELSGTGLLCQRIG